MSTKNRIDQARRKLDQAAPDNEQRQLYIRVLWADQQTGETETADMIQIVWGDPELQTGPVITTLPREFWEAL